MKQAVRGSNLSEYGLVIALVGIVAIPALMWMNDVVGNAYTTQNPVDKGGQLFSLLDKKNGPTHVYTDGTQLSIPVETADTIGANKFLASDASALQTTLSQNITVLPDGTAKATDTTSVSGVVRELATFLTDVEAQYGFAMGAEEKKRINNMVLAANEIARTQDTILRNHASDFGNNKGDLDNILFGGKGDSDQSYRSHRCDTPGENCSLKGDLNWFMGEFNAFKADLAKTPSDPALKADVLAKVESSAGIVAQLTLNNFIKPGQQVLERGDDDHAFHKEVSSLRNAALMKVDVQVANISTEQTAGVVRDQATLIKQEQATVGFKTNAADSRAGATANTTTNSSTTQVDDFGTTKPPGVVSGGSSTVGDACGPSRIVKCPAGFGNTSTAGP